METSMPERLYSMACQVPRNTMDCLKTICCTPSCRCWTRWAEAFGASSGSAVLPHQLLVPHSARHPLRRRRQPPPLTVLSAGSLLRHPHLLPMAL